MKQNTNEVSDFIDNLHGMERTGMTREEAEATATMMYNIVARATQPIVNRLDNRMDVLENRFDVMNNRMDVMEKQIHWCFIENIVAICVIAVGYVGIVITLLLKL